MNRRRHPSRAALIAEPKVRIRAPRDPLVDTFGGAGGESKARLFEVFGYAFFALKPE